MTIAPQVSQTEGPSGVNTTITTIRGVVKSNWKRHADVGNTSSGGANGGAAASPRTVFELHVQVPVGSRARITIPLLHASPTTATVTEVRDDVIVWSGSGSRQHNSDNLKEEKEHPEWLWKSAYLDAPDNEPSNSAIQLETTAGVFHFKVSA